MPNIFVRTFLRGLAVFLPIALSGWLLWRGLVYLNELFRSDGENAWSFPGVGLLTLLVLASVFGVLAEVRPTKALIEAVEDFMLKIPVIKHLYGTLKDFLDAFLGKTKRFDKPVFVQVGGGLDAQVMGFVTCDDLAAFGILDKVAVYLPQSYNIGGNLFILPTSRVTPINADSASVMSFIVSGGVTRSTDMNVPGKEIRGYSRRLQRAMRLRQERRTLS